MLSTGSPPTKFKPAQTKRRASEPIQSTKPTKISKTSSDVDRKPTGIEPFVVAHVPRLQRAFNDLKVPFGVQFELARVLASKADDVEFIERAIGELTTAQSEVSTTRNADAVSKIHALLEGEKNVSGKEASATAPWATLDLEEIALRQDEYAGVGHKSYQELGLEGFSADEESASCYFGGKVDFIIRLEEASDHTFRIFLDKATRAQSNKIKRRFGSTSLLRCKIPEQLINKKGQQIIKFLERPVVIFNWVFRAFYAKDDSVFFFRTNETLRDGFIQVDPTSQGLPLLDLLDWANSLEWNQGQKLSKWATRLSLVLSASVPGPLLDRKNMHLVDDIVSSPPDKSDMTDGCGTANLSFFTVIRERFNMKEAPSAVQFRIFGAKGMLLCDPRAEDSGEPKIWLRNSQIKIRFDPDKPADLSHLTVDILRLARVRSPARLSVETMVNLHHNGVPTSVFVEILKKNLADTIKPLLDWGGSDSDTPAMLRLWHAVEQSENVITQRRTRQDVTNIRFKGYNEQERDLIGEDDLDGVGGVEGRHSTAWWPDPHSGCPSSIAETIMGLLSSGFTPRNNAVMRNKLYRLIQSKITRKCTKHNWEILESATAFAVPDPYGVLGPNEIHFKSSRRELILENGSKTDIVTGDVLVWRNPCKLPTDVRKVQAVSHPDLAGILDVVVFPIEGPRRLIDFLAGGDYDGDRVVVLWDSQFVTPFSNSPEKHSIEPLGIKECFSEETELVQTYYERFLRRSEPGRIKSVQKHLLDGLQDRFLIGMYSMRHDKSTYMRGLDDNSTVREAYMFCSVLDALKSGRKLLPDVRSRDMRYEHKDSILRWKEVLGKLAPQDSSPPTFPSSTTIVPRNERQLGRFIMDELSKAAQNQYRQWMTHTQSIFDSKSTEKDNIQSTFLCGADKDLLAPYFDLVILRQARPKSADALLHDIGLIKEHVQKMKDVFEKKNGGGTSFTAKHIVARQDALRSVSKEFCSYPQLEDLEGITDNQSLARVRASIAYDMCKSNTGQQFPWMVAYNELCTIKARASPSGFRSMVGDFADHMKLTKAATQT
ncbi:hypothetical protein PQX77_013854 [Marasmius sp. AFHP31]|nr:hypothetical protein PQX77_013854 [Marasmius sp. AFHP31]